MVYLFHSFKRGCIIIYQNARLCSVTLLFAGIKMVKFVFLFVLTVCGTHFWNFFFFGGNVALVVFL